MDYRRFESIYHVLVAAQFDTLQAALRAVELRLGELTTILHRIEWDGEARIFKIHHGKLHFTREGTRRLKVWKEALAALGIGV